MILTMLIEWIQPQWSKDIPLTGLLVMEQARLYHEELNIKGKCEYSGGWLQKFKKRHGIEYFKICGEKAIDKAENYIDKFAKIVFPTSSCPKQIYNVDETALYSC